jgi:hypothetical protein
MFGKTMFKVAMIGIVAFALAGCGKAKGGEEAPVAKPAAVKMDLYVMSQCPYGVNALDAIIPAAEKIGDGFALNINYIGKENNGNLESMHGAGEVEGDIAQLCALKVAPKAHLKLIACMDKDPRAMPGNWEGCAKEAGIDMAAMKACKDGKDGKKLLAASFKVSEAAGAQGSPTIKINGKDYQGARRSADFVRAICDAFGGKDVPKACTDLPKPVAVKIIAITDKRCPTCDPTPVIESLKQVFPALSPTVLDYADPEGKKVFAEAGLKMLPAILFDDTIKGDKEGSEQMARWLTPAGRFQSLKIKQDFDPTGEICDNKIDDNGDGKIDCDDPTCKEALACRPEMKGHLDVFVMSECPFGVKGLDAMKEVLAAFGKEMTFGVHYIAEKTPDGNFSSMHGPGEVDEDFREICAQKYYGKGAKFMDYIWCRNPDIRGTDWKKCATGGIAAATIEKCATGDEGKKLLGDDILIAQGLKIGASPTWMINNRKTFNAIAANDIQKNFCELNAGLAGCAKTLSGPPAPPAGQAPAPQGGCGAN